MPDPVLALAVVALATVPIGVLSWLLRRRSAFGTEAERATFEVLHLANAAAPPFREGLTAATARRAIRDLRPLLGGRALALTGPSGLLAWEGDGDHHGAALPGLVAPVLAGGRPLVLTGHDLACTDAGCVVRAGVVVPIETEDTVVGTLATFGPSVGAGTIRAATEVARWVGTQIELGRLDLARERADAAEVRALRAEISPHFVYNALTAIASFVRTDPERARELLQQFAELSRYSFSQGRFTTLADELRAIDAYLMLERARFGDRLRVRVQVAPEVLPVVLPFLVLQPLVENAVRHGMAGRTDPTAISIVAEDGGSECRITIEDDGVGMDPEELRRRLAGEDESDSIGIVNVDGRMRQVFGDAYGLVVDTGPGAGTRVSLRAPKYRAGVRAS